MELKELITKIEQWAIDRELDKKATVEAQSIKTAEEMAELIIGISKDNIEVIKDSIGDVFVTLVIGNMIDNNINIEENCKGLKEKVEKIIEHDKKLEILSLVGVAEEVLKYGYYHHAIYYGVGSIMGIAKVYDLEFTDCVESAYNEIKDRRGVTKNGQFIKEEDL